MANEHLQQWTEGQPIVVTVNFDGVSIGGSVYVPKGYYLCEITECGIQMKADKSGLSSYFFSKIVGPEGCPFIGVELKDFGAAPIGDPTSDKVQMANKKWATYYISGLETAGITDMPSGQVNMAPEHYIGKRVALFLDDRVMTNKNSGKPMVVHDIKWVVSKTVYEQRPGPLDPNATGERPDPNSVARKAGAGPAPHMAATAIASGVTAPPVPPAASLPTPPVVVATPTAAVVAPVAPITPVAAPVAAPPAPVVATAPPLGVGGLATAGYIPQ